EVRTRLIGGARGMNNRKVLLVPDGLQRRHRGMQPEETIEIKNRAPGNVDRGTHRVIRLFAVWDYDVQSVGRAALKDHDQTLRAGTGLGGTQCCTPKECRNARGAHQREGAVAEKNSTGDHKSSEL